MTLLSKHTNSMSLMNVVVICESSAW